MCECHVMYISCIIRVFALSKHLKSQECIIISYTYSTLSSDLPFALRFTTSALVICVPSR